MLNKYSYAGTERCNEALKKLGKNYDIIVNIQGDEPLIEPEIIDGVVKALQVVILPLCISCYVLIIVDISGIRSWTILREATSHSCPSKWFGWMKGFLLFPFTNNKGIQQK